jgi:hypothetical protein
MKESKKSNRCKLSAASCQLGSRGGFSMVELLLTVIFVVLGSQMVQGGFLRAADMFGRYTHTLKTMVWANDQIAVSREALIRDEMSAGSDKGVLTRSGKEYSWTREVGSIEGPNLYAVHFLASWTEGGRPLSFDREIYVYRPDLSQG